MGRSRTATEPSGSLLLRGLCLGLLGLAMAGCAGTAATTGAPLEYSNRDEMLDGPGIFSGSRDGLRLFESDGGWFGSDDNSKDAPPSSALPHEASYRELEAF